eukprot:617575-Amphidinium_carterae.1
MYASKGRTPDFPRVATPNDFRYDDHGQSIAPNAQQALDAPPGAPTIIKIGEPTPTPQWGHSRMQRRIYAAYTFDFNVLAANAFNPDALLTAWYDATPAASVLHATTVADAASSIYASAAAGAAAAADCSKHERT